MSHDQERIAVLETEVKNLLGWMKTVDDRLRAVERNMWIGIGVLVAADAVLKFLLK